jgi:hypothetical protein
MRIGRQDARSVSGGSRLPARAVIASSDPRKGVPGGSLCQAALLVNRDGFDPHVHYFDGAVPVQISGEIASGV